MAKKPVQDPTVALRVTGPAPGRYRGSFGIVRHFTPEPQEFTDLDLTEEEIDELCADPELKVDRRNLVDPAVSAAEQAATEKIAADKVAADQVAADKAAAEAASKT